MEDKEKEIWIFLSHSSADFDKVRLIRNYLEEKSYRPLMFYLKCLETEEETFDLIKREIDVRTRFILCNSKNAQNSDWVRKEMDYIKNARPKRSYEVIDLSKPLEQLKPELDKYMDKTNVFISYSLLRQHVFDMINERLSKYDIRVFYPDKDAKLRESLGDQDIKNTITYVSSYGYYILLADDDSIKGEWAIRELEQAIEMDAKIFVIALSENALEWCRYNNKNIPKSHIVKISVNPLYDSYTADEITDIILSKVLTPGAIITHGDNFRTGKNAAVDEKEANRLNEILIRIAKETHSPDTKVFLVDSYSKGLHGFPKDLNKAQKYISKRKSSIVDDNIAHYLNITQERIRKKLTRSIKRHSGLGDRDKKI